MVFNSPCLKLRDAGAVLIVANIIKNTTSSVQHCRCFTKKRDDFSVANHDASDVIFNAKISYVANYDASIASYDTSVANYKASIANYDAIVANYKASIANYKASIANDKASIANHDLSIVIVRFLILATYRIHLRFVINLSLLEDAACAKILF